ncbi:class I SAM-dependent methyltransferase [Bacillus sp. 31A1R]|uniref:Class I SAM-dependent methyltransferase n=1 Tax=Robertmurraya mangrovi TaxID=3098077 RepID=A0ABU5J4F1_9BACI|nr:class I SAM-dependent methyltransferase [Bacillus sp. 31A1R]MDZ5474273.1 class I SAM-dependent methyltransferase [Bacillus sp. 31A1R]
MSNHYYSREQTVESNPKFWDFTLRNQKLKFKTDNGVFSKGEVDFGSRLLIETFEAPNVEGDILDVGCGYGPIGLSLAKGTDRNVHMVDVNDRAINLAKENAQLNNISNVTIYESDRLINVTKSNFSAILTNPPIRAGKKVVHDIYEQSYEHLRSGGELWVVIQKKQGAPSTIDKLTELFGEVETVDKKKGYFILRTKKN